MTAVFILVAILHLCQAEKYLIKVKDVGDQEVVHPAEEVPEEIPHPVEDEIIPESKVEHDDVADKAPEEARVVKNKDQRRRMFRTKTEKSGSDDIYGTVKCKYNCKGWPNQSCRVFTTGAMPSNDISIKSKVSCGL